MKKYLNTVIILLVFGFSSCDNLVYSPSEEPYTEIALPTNEMTINLSVNKDTLLVAGDVILNYSIDLKGKKLKRVVMIVDSNQTSYPSNLYDFMIRTNNLTDGYHKLRLEVWAHSGSGSLADKADGEFMVMSNSWTLLVNNIFFELPFNITSIEKVDGSLKINWEKTPFLNFSKITIYRAIVSATSIAPYFAIGHITNNELNYFYDRSFVGGKYAYKLDFQIRDDDHYQTVTSNVRIFEDEISNMLSFEKIDDTKLKIKWNKNKYYSNFDKYRLRRSLGSGNNGFGNSTKDFTFANIADTSFIDEPGFGSKIYYNLYTYGDNGTVFRSSEASFFLGKQFTSISKLEYVQSSNTIYLNGKDRFDANTLEGLSSGSYNISVSKSGNYAFSNLDATSNLEHPHFFVEVNSLSLTQIGSIVTTDDYLGYYSTNSFFKVTEKGYCLYLGYRYEEPTRYGPPALVLFDVNNTEIIAKDSSGHNSQFHLSKYSTEGEYIYTKGKIYNLQNKELAYRFKTNGSFRGFTNTGKEFIILDQQNVNIYKCNNNSLVTSFNLNSYLNNVLIDPVTNYLGCIIEQENKESYFLVYDISTQAQIHKIKLSNYYGASRSDLHFYLINSRLFSRSGFYIDLN